MTTTCDNCGKEYAIGEWPFCPHGVPMEYHPFVPRFEIASGEYITSLAHRWRVMKEKNLDYAGVKVGDPRCMV